MKLSETAHTPHAKHAAMMVPILVGLLRLRRNIGCRGRGGSAVAMLRRLMSRCGRRVPYLTFVERDRLMYHLDRPKVRVPTAVSVGALRLLSDYGIAYLLSV